MKDKNIKNGGPAAEAVLNGPDGSIEQNDEVIVKEESVEKDGVKKRFFTFHVDTSELLPASEAEREQLVRMRESTTYWKDVRRRFGNNKVAMFGMWVLIIVMLFAFIGPMIAPYTYEQQIRGDERQGPSLKHPFGTDALGRDMMVRVMIGTRISLLVGLVASVLETLIGGLYGAISGYSGGRVDTVMMRIAEVIYSIPDVMIIILLQIALKEPINSLYNVPALAGLVRIGAPLISIFIAFSLLYWVGMARMMRSQILVLKQMEYVTVAKAFGSKGGRIIRKHLLPNAMSTVLVTAMFQIPQAIFAESFLSFIGLGVRAPMASLGSLASEALQGITSYPHLLIAPAVMISVIMLAFNQFGDGLRDALDPRMRD